MRPTFGLLALVAFALGYFWPMQVTGDNQNVHYALVKALARGVPYIDETLPETGDLQSHDVARHDAHLYAVKAPGLAMAALPAYALVRATGMRTTGDPTRALWVLNAFTSALATVVLLLLVRDLAERIEPGYGSATAVIVGLGALTLPFATLFFSHAVGALFAFAAFWLLWRARDRGARFVAAAGVLAGLAVVVEHPTVWIAAILLGFAYAGRGRMQRALAFLAGTAVGVLPLLAFNAWAFGNPLHTPYSDYYEQAGETFVPVGLLHWDQFSRTMFSSLGLITLAPVLAAGLAGIVLLYRRGLRAEALVCAAVPVVLVAYFSRIGAFGGLGPPRYLTPMMPFVLVPLAPALRRWPLTTLALAAITCLQAVLMTATGPLAAYDGEWLTRVVHRQFVSTAAAFVDITGWYAIAPFLLAAAAAAVLAVASVPRLQVDLNDAAAAAAGACAWALAAAASYNDYGRSPSVSYVVVVAGLVILAALVAARRLPRAEAVAG